jgi:hypothetical protein
VPDRNINGNTRLQREIEDRETVEALKPVELRQCQSTCKKLVKKLCLHVSTARDVSEAAAYWWFWQSPEYTAQKNS